MSFSLQLALENLILQQLRPYFVGVNANSLHSDVLWRGSAPRGEINLENLIVKPDVLNQFQLCGFQVIGKVKKLRLKIPWHSLFTLRIELEVSGVNIAVKQKEERSIEELAEALRAAKKEAIESRVLALQETARLRGQQEADGPLAALIRNLVNNLLVSIREVFISVNSADLGIGFSSELGELKALSTDRFFDNQKRTSMSSPCMTPRSSTSGTIPARFPSELSLDSRDDMASVDSSPCPRRSSSTPMPCTSW